MRRHFDHVTVAVTDLAAAIGFFAPEARHITLVLKDFDSRLEVQLLHFLDPPVKREGDVARLDPIGFNHICFAVSDIDGRIAEWTEPL
jgi:catechol 2,3-dioxygenase-like lactoylglutathione lyase family enzyme